MASAPTDAGIIVLGHPRSGTTLLRRLLDAHSAIASPPETHLFNAVSKSLDVDITADGVDMGMLAGLEFAGFKEEEVLDRLRAFTFGLLDDFAKAQGKRRWAEKTAFSIFHLDQIEQLCSDQVYYLGIIRHPFDVALSTAEFCRAAGVFPDGLHKYVQNYPQPVEAFTRSWIDTTAALMELGKHRQDRCLLVRYEDLVEDPDGLLADIVTFIGEEPEEGLAETGLGKDSVPGFSDHKGYGETSVHSKSIGQWQAIPSPQIARLGALVNPLLEQCGYDVIENTTPISTAAARRRYANGLAINAQRRHKSS